jgi:hypothetical protein
VLLSSVVVVMGRESSGRRGAAGAARGTPVPLLALAGRVEERPLYQRRLDVDVNPDAPGLPTHTNLAAGSAERRRSPKLGLAEREADRPEAHVQVARGDLRDERPLGGARLGRQRENEARRAVPGLPDDPRRRPPPRSRRPPTRRAPSKARPTRGRAGSSVPRRGLALAPWRAPVCFSRRSLWTGSPASCERSCRARRRASNKTVRRIREFSSTGVRSVRVEC